MGIKQGSSILTWIIDPLDETTNFVHGYTFYTISIAVYRRSTTLAGVVQDAHTEYVSSDLKEEGSSYNGKLITVSSTKLLGQSLLATGLPYVQDNI